MRILHLSDIHLTRVRGARTGGVDPDEALRGMLHDCRDLPGLDAIVVTGDVADEGAPEAYTEARRQIGGFAEERRIPAFFTTGNHDDRTAFTAVLGHGHLTLNELEAPGEPAQRRAAPDAPDHERAVSDGSARRLDVPDGSVRRRAASDAPGPERAVSDAPAPGRGMSDGPAQRFEVPDGSVRQSGASDGLARRRDASGGPARRLEASDGARAASSTVFGHRIVTLDSQVPGRAHGRISGEQLDWLRSVLAERTAYGSILAFHHPPIALPGVAFQQEFGLVNAADLADVIVGTDVRVILCGHFHLQLSGVLAGVPVWVTPGVLTRFDLTAAPLPRASASLIDLSDPHCPLMHTLHAREYRY